MHYAHFERNLYVTHYYRPRTNTITVRRTLSVYWRYTPRPTSMLDVVLNRLEGLRKGGAKVTKTTRTLHGKRMTVYVIQDKASMREYVIDPAKNRVASTSRREMGPSGESEQRVTTFDYPEVGPKDIYDLGVPRDAKVEDRGPSSDLLNLLDDVQAAEVNFEGYYALACSVQKTKGQATTHIRVTATYVKSHRVPWATYVKSNRVRQDIYDVLIPKGRPVAPAATRAALAGWVKARKPTRIILCKDRYAASFTLDDKGRVRSDKLADLARPDPVNFWHLRVAWGKTPLKADGAWGPLVGIEHRRYVEMPGEKTGRIRRWYFNPARALLCERYVDQRDTNGDDKIDRHEERKILEYAKTPGGHWYPRTMSSVTRTTTPKAAAETTRVDTVYVDDSRKIDEKLFDPKGITAESLHWPSKK